MLFSANEVIDSLKNMELADAPDYLSHCQYLKYKAEALGFPSYESFKAYLENPPQDRIEKIHTELMRKICSVRIPKEDKCYVQMISFDDNTLGFQSYWIGWDSQGNEVRVPRGDYFISDEIKQYREHYSDPVYVVETKIELVLWQFLWRANAIIPYELAEKTFKSLFNQKCFVAQDPPMDLINNKVHKKLKGSGLV